MNALIKSPPQACQGVGVFDSGVGGLTVLRALRNTLPHESFIYVGDTARAPYGGRSEETLLTYSREIVQFLIQQQVKTIVFACGTCAATAYPVLVEEFPHIPFINVLRPGALAITALIAKKPTLRVGFIATEATIKRGTFKSLVHAINPNIHIAMRACPLFAPMAEHGLFTGDIIRWAAENYLGDWRGKIDILVLGCTHYPLLNEALAQVLPEVQQINLGESTAQALAEVLREKELCSMNTIPTHHFYISGEAKIFDALATKILGEEVQGEVVGF